MKYRPSRDANAILFDLASTLAVPRISKHINKLMWPVLTADERSEIDELAAKISQLRGFECEHERWPFHGGSEKVASVVKTIAATQDGDSNWKQRVICYTREYYLELSFQRFFAWIVYESAGDIKGSEAHFRYRNAYANARSVLAMPLLVDLTRQTGVVVGQGNFGYKPARNLQWIYPHLSHYLSAFYFPWVPNVGLDVADADAALSRAITRSRHVSFELFQLVREGSPLLAGIGKERLEEGIVALFGAVGISPFVRSAIVTTNFIDLCKTIRGSHEDLGQFETRVLNDEISNRGVAQYLQQEPARYERSVHDKLIQTCRQNLNSALCHQLGHPNDSHDFFALNEPRLEEFLKWRYFEERLRLTIDRLLLERRYLDPPLARSRFSCKFENLGLFGVEVPEIQFNLYLEEFNEYGRSPEQQSTPRSEACQEWLAEARDSYRKDKKKMWAHGSFPFHALFETYLMETDPEHRFGPFWMALLLSHLVPPIDPQDKKAKHGRKVFLEHAKKKIQEWHDLKPFAPLAAILSQKREEILDPHYGEDCSLWLWLEDKLDKLCRQQWKVCWQDVTFKQLVEEILIDPNQSWVDPRVEIEREMSKVLAGRTFEGAELTSDQSFLLRVLSRHEMEALEREERGRRFFSYASFFGVNTMIFRALTDLKYGRNFITIRLIATERSSSRAASSLETQDHADFVGSYVVWQRDENNELMQQPPHGAYVPRLDAWREEQAINISSSNSLQATSLTELHNQKSVIKNLGISLLNQERIKEQERLNALVRKETTRSTIAGIMARNMSHNIGSHVLASFGLLEGVDLSEIEKLHNFLQQRMDFIAQVVTYTPSWGEPMFFFKDLLGEFFNQYLLLDNLIKDQGYPEITFFVKIEKSNQEFVFERKRVCAKCEAVVRDENQPCKCVDFHPRSTKLTGSWQLSSDRVEAISKEEFLVAIPGGSIGAHAFYVILENMLRNSAKYGVQQDQNEGLQVHITVIEEDYHYSIKVWDNTGKRVGHDPQDPKICQCPVCVVQRRLADELIDSETGTVTEKSRGIHEMKECATILVSPYVEELGKIRGGKRVALWADAETHNENEYLQYSLILQKPRLVGIVDICGETSSAARSVGIFSYTNIEDLACYPHQLGVIYLRPESRGSVVQFLKAHHYLLPYRLLLVDKTETGSVEIDVHPRRYQWCELDVPTSEDRSVWQSFVLDLWEIWLQRFKRPGQAWQMLVSLDRPAGHAAFVRWREALETFKSPLVNVYLARSKDRAFGAVEFPREMSYQEFRSKLESSKSSWVVFDNHRAILQDPETRKPFAKPKELAAYQEFGSKYSIKLFQTLESPPTSKFGFRLFVLGLLESSLMKVVIVDERVADAIYDREKGFDTGARDLLRNVNCFPVFSVRAESDGKMMRRFVSETIGQRSEETNKPDWEKIDEAEGLYLAEDPYINSHVSGVLSSTVETLDQSDAVDTVIIHQGVIDILDQNHLWLGEGHNDYHLHLLHKLSPSIIITSGRGRTIRHVENKEIPFVEFSIIKDNTYAGLSKYHLVRSILSVAGEKRELNTDER